MAVFVPAGTGRTVLPKRTMNSISTIAFVAGGAAVLAVALGFANVKPWIYIGGAAVVVGFFTQPSSGA